MISEGLSAAGCVSCIGLQCMQIHNKSLLTNLDIIIVMIYYCIEEVRGFTSEM